MDIYPLGIAGFIPTVSRETSCLLLKHGTTLFVFDAGTGIKRLAEPQIVNVLANAADSIHLFFSHLHNDHTSGLTWLLRLFRGKIFIYVPESPLVQFNGREIIEVLTSPHLFGLPFKKWPNYGGLISYKDLVVKVGDIRIDVLPQKHHGGSVGLRIGRFAYITDTEPNDEHLGFIAGCELVFVDTMHDRLDYQSLNLKDNQRAEHGWSIGNGELASKSGIKQLGLIHIDPFYDSNRIANLLSEAKDKFADVIVPQEGILYSVND